MADNIETALGGSYEMPDGRKFWVDERVAKEMARRVRTVLRDCNICGGRIDLTDAKEAPTTHVATGGGRDVR